MEGSFVEEISFAINTNKQTIEEMNKRLVSVSKKEKDYYVYEIKNPTLIRSLMKDNDFAKMYQVILLNHLFKSLIVPELRMICPANLIFSIDLDDYDPDKTFAEIILDFVSSNKEYEMLIIEFERLIESYGFKCRANHIFVWQLMEVIDISDLNDGLYEFKL